MRNTNKYTKMYSGGTPIFVEDNIFEILIPMDNVAELQVGPEETSIESEKTDKETNKENKKTSIESEKTGKETSKENEKTNKETSIESKKTSKETDSKIFDILESKPEITVRKIAEVLNMSVSGVRYHIEKMKKAGIIEHIGSTKKGKWIVHK